jgi:hypothetical protein
LAQINVTGVPPQGGGSNKYQEAYARYSDQLSQLEKRSQDPLTPSKYATFDRAIDRFEATIRRFEAKFGGTSAGFESRISGLRQGMGTPESAFKVSQILRMGNIAQGAGIKGGLGNFQVGKTDAELKRIEATLEKQLRLESNPSALAALQRQKDAIYIAKSRIAANGPPGAVGGILQGVGGLAGGSIGAMAGRIGVAGAVAGLAADAAVKVVEAPFDVRQKYAALLARGRMYRDYRIDVGRQALGGGYSGEELSNLMLPPKNAAQGFLPTSDQSPEMQRFGLSPQQALQNIQNFGVPARSAREALNNAEAIRLASIMPGTSMLPEAQIGQMAGQTRTLQSAGFNMNSYLSQLQKVMSLSVSAGLDSSRLASSWSGLIQATGRSSLSLDTGSLGDFYSRLVGSGSPAMRSGEGQADIMSGFNNSMATLGSGANVPGNVVFSSFLSHNGNPKDEEGLRKAFGMSKDEWTQLVSTPGAQRALSNFIGAQKAGNGAIALPALGALVSGHPELEDRILSGGGFVVPDYMKDTVRASTFGGSYMNQISYGSTLPSQGASLGGMAANPGSPLFDQIKAAADKNGVPLDVMLATVSKESGFKNTAPWAGHNAAGLGQIMPGTAEGLGYSPDDRMDPSKNLDMTAKYLKQQLDATNGDARKAYERYHYGPGGQYNEADADAFDQKRQQYANVPEVLKNLQGNATEQTTSMAASRYADQVVGGISDAIVASFKAGAAAVDELAASAKNAASQLNAIGGVQKMPGGFVSPDGMYVPLPSQQPGGSQGALK